MSLRPAGFSGDFLRNIELGRENFEYKKCRGMIGLQFFYKHLSLILVGSRIKQDRIISCQAVSEMGWNFVDFQLDYSLET